MVVAKPLLYNVVRGILYSYEKLYKMNCYYSCNIYLQKNVNLSGNFVIH